MDTFEVVLNEIYIFYISFKNRGINITKIGTKILSKMDLNNLIAYRDYLKSIENESEFDQDKADSILFK